MSDDQFEKCSCCRVASIDTECVNCGAALCEDCHDNEHLCPDDDDDYDTEEYR